MIFRTRLLTPISPTQVQWISDARVEIEGGMVVSVGEWDGGVCHADIRPAVLTPGFVDAHLHYPQTRIVGAASGPLLEWLERSTFPAEMKFANIAYARDTAALFTRKMAAAGTTMCMAYGSVHDTSAELLLLALANAGLRGLAGPVLMDRNCPEELQVPPEKALADLEILVDRWDGHDDGRLRVCVAPRFALSCSKEMLLGAGELADRLNLWVTTHLSENLDECRVATEMFSAPDYLSIYEDAGLLHDRSVYAHCIYLSEDEWDRFARAGAVVAHCPDSNDFLGSGSMPLDAPRIRRIPVAVGTDIAAGRSFSVRQTLASAYDNALRRRIPLDPRELLWMGTRGGALALGCDTVGLVAPGMEADSVALDVPDWVETEDEALGYVLFDRDSGPAIATWVRGVEVWRKPQPE